MSGRCPAIRFTIGGQLLVTDGNTDFKKTSCEALVEGMQATIKAQPLSNGTAIALKIAVKGGKGN